MTDEEAFNLNLELGGKINRDAQAAFDELMQRISDGESPRDAIKAVTEGFTGEFYEATAIAFSKILDSAIGIADIKAWPVGKITLSDRLYAHTREVEAVTERIIKEHIQGFVQARELLLQLYEGYQFKDDPLKIKTALPKYLRQVLTDQATDREFSLLAARIKAGALKTPALKAAYLQALDAIEQGVGQQRLRTILKTAWYERNRYFASRIARTELHRAYEDQKAIELMADDDVVWVRYQMSKAHPKTDQCDYFAGQDKYGMGKGVYPKALCPKPPMHPHCLCVCVPQYQLDPDAQQKARPDAAKAFMAGLSDYEQRLVAGSADRLNAFRGGKSLEAIYDASVRPEFKMQTVGDVKKR